MVKDALIDLLADVAGKKVCQVRVSGTLPEYEDLCPK